jgi:hypothetical protein
MADFENQRKRGCALALSLLVNCTFQSGLKSPLFVTMIGGLELNYNLTSWKTVLEASNTTPQA